MDSLNVSLWKKKSNLILAYLIEFDLFFKYKIVDILIWREF